MTEVPKPPTAPKAPVILLGMHRSGTTLLTRCLAQMGLFPGWKLQRNHEAVFFRRLNNDLFELAGARWDEPDPVRDFLKDPATVENLSAGLADTMKSLQAFSYLGPSRFLRTRSLHRLSEPWGWKDPRNTFFLGVWCRVFPGARVIHVVRHGVDVAASLRTRHESRSRDDAEASSRTLRVRQLQPNPAISERCASLSGGFTLWKEYLAQAREELAKLEDPVGSGRGSMEVRFEDLLAKPEEVLPGVATFAGLEPSGTSLEKARTLVAPSKGDRWKGDEELRAFARTVENDLAAEGYVG